MLYKSDQAHSGLDNVAFLSRDQVSFVEDAGDTLHSQRNALDSGYVFNVNTDYSNPSAQPVRWLAEGRDASATLDSANNGFGTNEGDNEITGSTSPTAIRPRTGSSAQRCRTWTLRSGGGSTPSSTGTTSPTR